MQQAVEDNHVIYFICLFCFSSSFTSSSFLLLPLLLHLLLLFLFLPFLVRRRYRFLLCTQPLPPSPSASWASKLIGGGDLTMHSAAEFFSFGALDWTYVGTRRTRGLNAQVWVDRKETRKCAARKHFFSMGG